MQNELDFLKQYKEICIQLYLYKDGGESYQDVKSVVVNV